MIVRGVALAPARGVPGFRDAPFEPRALLALDFRRGKYRNGSTVVNDLLALGPELVANGGFDADTGWTKGVGWSISGGVATNAGAGVDPLSQAAGLTIGKVYSITFTVTARTAGAVTVAAGGAAVSTYRSSTGTFTETMVCAGNGLVYVQQDANFEGSVDNVSVREVLTGAQYSRSGADRRVGSSLLLNSAGVPALVAGEGLYVYGAFTNLLTYSQEVDNAAWAKNASTVTANAAAAPDGSLTADKLVENSTNNYHSVRQSKATASGTVYTTSVYAKAGERSWLKINEGSNVTATAYFNLAAGTVGTVTGTGSPSARIEAVGGGWYRCSMTFTAGGAASNAQIGQSTDDNVFTHQGDGVSGLYVWGGQFVAGSLPGPYVPTTSLSATAGADILKLTLSPPSEWTFFFDGETTPEAGDYRMLASWENGATEQIAFYRSPGSSTVTVLAYVGGVTQFSATFAAPSVRFRAAITFSGGRYQAAVNAVLGVAVTGKLNTAANSLHVGGQGEGQYPANGPIREGWLRPYGMTDAELQALTTV